MNSKEIIQAIKAVLAHNSHENIEKLAKAAGLRLAPLPLLDEEIEQILFFSSLSDEGERFNPLKFEKIIAALKRQNIPLLLDEEGGRFAKQMGAEAVYYPTEEGQSGFFAFPKNPTRTQVIEELLHYGQHRRVKFKSVSWQEIVKFELEAQQKLLEIGAKLNWSDNELMQIIRAMRQWQQEYGKLQRSNHANKN